MRTKLKNIGSGVALVLDPPVCDALNIHPEDEVEVELRSHSLTMYSVEQPNLHPMETFQWEIENPDQLEGDSESKELADLYF